MPNKLFSSIFKGGILAIFLSLLVALVLLQANPLTNYPSRDGGIYAYIGHIILEGKLPYIDAWESKPPGIFYLDALALWLGQGTRWGIWFVEFVFLFFASAIGYKLMRLLWNPGAAIFGTIVWLSGLNRLLSGGNFTEEYPLLFNFLALYIFWKSLQAPKKWVYDFMLGLTLAFSFLFRANNIGVQVSIVLALLIMGIITKELKLFAKKMAVVSIAVILICGSVCVYFWADHTLGAMLEAAFVYNFSYTGNHVNLLSSILTGFDKLGFPACVALVGFFCAICLLARRIKDHSLDPFSLFLVTAWPVEMFLSSLSGRGYGHYFISWLPSLALLCGAAFSLLAPQILTEKVLYLINKQTSFVLCGTLILTTVLFQTDLKIYVNSFDRVLFKRSTGIQKILPVAEYVRSHTTPDDTVLVWGGQAGINLMAQRDAPTRYIFYPLFIDSPITPKIENVFMSDLKNYPPSLIIDAYINDPDNTLSLDAGIRSTQISAGKGQFYQPNNLDDVLTFIKNNYELEIVIDNYDIYKLQTKP